MKRDRLLAMRRRAPSALKSFLLKMFGWTAFVQPPPVFSKPKNSNSTMKTNYPVIHESTASPPPHFITPLSSDVAPWPQPVDVQSLLCEIAELLRRFVVLPRWGAETLALWTLHTYAYQLRDVTTYIGLESPEKRCGKTTLLSVLHELTNRAVASSNISPPAFFRVIEDLSPTLLIDEVDTFLNSNDQLRGILNSGYHKKTAFVLRAAPSAVANGETDDESSAAPGAVKR